MPGHGGHTSAGRGPMSEPHTAERLCQPSRAVLVSGSGEHQEQTALQCATAAAIFILGTSPEHPCLAPLHGTRIKERLRG